MPQYVIGRDLDKVPVRLGVLGTIGSVRIARYLARRLRQWCGRRNRSNGLVSESPLSTHCRHSCRSAA